MSLVEFYNNSDEHLINYLPGLTALEDDAEEWTMHYNKISELTKDLLFTKLARDNSQTKMLSSKNFCLSSSESYQFIFSRLLRRPIQDNESKSLEYFISHASSNDNVISTPSLVEKAMHRLRDSMDTIYSIYAQTPTSVRCSAEWVKIERELIDELKEIFPDRQPYSFESKIAFDFNKFKKHPIKFILSIPNNFIKALQVGYKSLTNGSYTEGCLRIASVGIPVVGAGFALIRSAILPFESIGLVALYAGVGYLVNSIIDTIYPHVGIEEQAISTDLAASQRLSRSTMSDITLNQSIKRDFDQLEKDRKDRWKKKKKSLAEDIKKIEAREEALRLKKKKIRIKISSLLKKMSLSIEDKALLHQLQTELNQLRE